MRKICSSAREKLLKFKAKGREFSKILRSLEQLMQTVKGQTNVCFLICSWRFLRSNKLEQLEFKLLGFRNMQGKLENVPIAAEVLLK